MSASDSPRKVFVSAGEPSGDLHAAALVAALKREWPETDWFGCTGPRMRQAGVRTILDQSALSVVGLVEVVSHLPGIYGHYRRLQRQIRAEGPDLAIVTDSPDFHLRLAGRLREMEIPVIYLVAPQAWAWRQGRVKPMRRNIAKLLCLFPFEETFFRERGVDAHYIGHPLANRIHPQYDRRTFFERHRLAQDRPMVALCPGSRRGEISRHLPALVDAVARIAGQRPASFVLATPAGSRERMGEDFFRERIPAESIQVIEGETWDVLAHADVALTASGTVTMEAALLGTPMVTYYKVTALSWQLGKLLVKVPFYSMVNLIAERRLVTELMQNEMTGPRLAQEALRLLESASVRAAMKRELAEVARKLSSSVDPMERAAGIVKEFFHAQR
jgi:lipid-A-disaccharide synthase